MVSSSDNTIRAYFGYINENQSTVTLDNADTNTVVPTAEGSVPSSFAPGVHKGVFSVVFPTNGSAVWTLQHDGGEVQTATATKDSTPCAPVVPVAECLSISGDGVVSAHFGYNNSNEFNISMPVGANNGFTPAPQDRGQPTTFIAGNMKNVFQVALPAGPPVLGWNLFGVTASVSNTTPTCTPNQAPTCVAGPEQGYVSGCQGIQTTVNLDGSGSKEPDGTKLSFSWSTSCSGSGLTGSNTVNPTLLIPADSKATNCSVSLTVSDGLASSSCGASVSVAACPTDCLGNVLGGAVVDQCGVCGGNGTTCLDCAGVPFGTAKLDLCGVCNGTNACLDCNGVVNGPAKVDECGVCGGDGTSCLQCTESDISEELITLNSQDLFDLMLSVIRKIEKKGTFVPRYWPRPEAQDRAVDRAIDRYEVREIERIRSKVLSFGAEVVKNCTNVFCTQIDQQPIKIELERAFRKHHRAYTRWVVRSLAQPSISVRQSKLLLKEGRRILQTKFDALAEIPRFASKCNLEE